MYRNYDFSTKKKYVYCEKQIETAIFTHEILQLPFAESAKSQPQYSYKGCSKKVGTILPPRLHPPPHHFQSTSMDTLNKIEFSPDL